MQKRQTKDSLLTQHLKDVTLSLIPSNFIVMQLLEEDTYNYSLSYIHAYVDMLMTSLFN